MSAETNSPVSPLRKKNPHQALHYWTEWCPVTSCKMTFGTNRTISPIRVASTEATTESWFPILKFQLKSGFLFKYWGKTGWTCDIFEIAPSSSELHARLASALTESWNRSLKSSSIDLHLGVVGFLLLESSKYKIFSENILYECDHQSLGLTFLFSLSLFWDFIDFENIGNFVFKLS